MNSKMNKEWAENKFNIQNPTQESIRKFDNSEDGKQYLLITGMTMWTNLHGQSLSTTNNFDD